VTGQLSTSGLRGWLDNHTRLYVPTRRVRFDLALRTLDRFASGRRLTVLDAGCSEGLLAAKIALRHPDWSVDAIDLDEAALRIGEAWARTNRVDNLTFARADLTEPIATAKYDAVLAIECLTLIPDDTAALASLADALRPSGLFLAHVPVDDWQPVLPGARATWPGEQRHGYARDEIVRKIEHAGLTVVSVIETDRTMARAGRELSDRVGGRTLKLRAAWYPVSVAMSNLERWGLTWGAVGAYFIEARRREP
jgi:SAM-dependent methyltransferase